MNMITREYIGIHGMTGPDTTMKSLSENKYLIKDGHLPDPRHYHFGSRYGPRSRYGSFGRYDPYWHDSYDHRYQASRKGKRDGNDEYGWWYEAPRSRKFHGSRRGRRYGGHWDWDKAPMPPRLPWQEKGTDPYDWNEATKDPVGWYNGDIKSWYDKYVPTDVAARINKMVTEQLESMQK